MCAYSLSWEHIWFFAHFTRDVNRHDQVKRALIARLYILPRYCWVTINDMIAKQRLLRKDN
jgi:hypothetical protein